VEVLLAGATAPEPPLLCDLVEPDLWARTQGTAGCMHDMYSAIV
jgi:hypothetical protein